MAVTNIPNVQNWTVTPQNGQSGYFDLMNTWLGQSTLVIASLQSAITAQNAANIEINDLADDTNTARDETIIAKDEAISALALLSAGSINDTTIATNKAYSNSKSNTLLALKMDKNIDSLTAKTTPVDADEFVLADSTSTFSLKKLTWSNIKATLKTYFDTLYDNFIANDSRVKTALNASGTAPIYACRAWVNFNGTGTVAIRASGNVSSITDNGTGNYTVNFTTAMTDSNYCVEFTHGTSVNNDGCTIISMASSNVNVFAASNSAGYDPTFVLVSIFR